MEAFVKHVGELFGQQSLLHLGQGLVMLLLGLLIAKVAAAGLGRLVAGRSSPQAAMLARRLAFYTLAGLAVAGALRQIGVDLSVLLGAAGVLTVAIGFASQTSASNLISGLFLIGERPFVLGDIVRVNEAVGTVVAIDLMAVKLRTFDNLYVRIPNEALLRSQITNLTHYPIRRVDLALSVAYKEDLERVREILLAEAVRNPLCMDEPVPLFKFVRFGDSSVDLEFSVWGTVDNFLELKTSMYLGIKAAFDREEVEIPFPHRSLYAGSASAPLPVRLVAPAPGRVQAPNTPAVGGSPADGASPPSDPPAPPAPASEGPPQSPAQPAGHGRPDGGRPRGVHLQRV